MSAAIKALEAELTEAKRVVALTTERTRQAIAEGQRAQRELDGDRRIVGELEEAIAALKNHERRKHAPAEVGS